MLINSFKPVTRLSSSPASIQQLIIISLPRDYNSWYSQRGSLFDLVGKSHRIRSTNMAPSNISTDVLRALKFGLIISRPQNRLPLLEPYRFSMQKWVLMSGGSGTILSRSQPRVHLALMTRTRVQDTSLDPLGLCGPALVSAGQ